MSTSGHVTLERRGRAALNLWAVRNVALLMLVLLCATWAVPMNCAAAELLDGTPIEQRSPELQTLLPAVTAPSAALVTHDGRELWTRDAEERRAMASTTKIMTAIVVLEQADLDDSVTVSPAAVAVGESAAGLRAGDVYTVRQLLEAMLVKSGNEAAVALAEHVSGTQEAFVAAMNARAGELGLDGTAFANPHGLDAQMHYSTARDLSVLSRVAMGFDEFRRIVGSISIDLPTPRGSRTLYNSNMLIGRYEGATGVKTGWTGSAGYCLVATAERDGVELTAVIMGATTEQARFDQARALFDWGFAHYSIQDLASAEETAGLVPVADYLDVSVGTILGESATGPVFDLEGEPVRTVSLPETIDAPVRRGQRIGTLTFSQEGRLIAQVPIVAAWDVEKPGLFERVWIGMLRLWRGVFGAPQPAGAIA